ncbi:DUF748 domain-containing protein [Marinobacter changyiensis]|uniref:DUF748 domain-containing protein n=1 Tax=Marinobacter changyiensis TaxID=2604091 RepID=UPI001264F7C2|nr:DUF748 domain-containing protein [Marinobacter changyiensis]
MATPVTAKPWHKRLSVWLVIAVLFYALLVGGVLPWWLEREVPDRLQQHLGWTATVDDIRINPINLSVGVTELTAVDASGEPVFALQHLDLNPALLALFSGTVAFDHIILDDPFVRVDLLDDAGNNFARDWQANNKVSAPVEGRPKQTAPPPELYFGKIALNGGELLLRDMSQPETTEFQISPLQVELTNLATYERDGTGEYILSAAINDQLIDWQGTLSLTPLLSRGRLSLTDIDYNIIRHFAGEYLPYELQDGVVSIETDYDMAMYDNLQLVTENGTLYLRELALAVPGESESAALELAEIKIEQIGFSLYERILTVGSANISNTIVNLNRNGDGVINLMKPFSGDDETDSDSTAASEPFQWTVGPVQLTESAVRWRDEQTARPVNLAAENINLSVTGLSDQLAEPIQYELGFNLASGGQVSVRGQATRQPFTLQASTRAEQVALPAFGPYLQQTAAVNIRKGLLSFDGSLDLDGQNDPLTGTYSGQGRIDELDATLKDNDEPLLAWQTLILEPVEYNLAPARLEIGTVTLQQPKLGVVRLADGSHNVEQILASGPGQSAASDTGSEEEPRFIFRVGEFVMESGEVAYSDRTLEPPFSTRLHALDGALTGLSTITPQQAKIGARGRIGDSGKVDVEGTIATLGTNETTNLHLVMTELALPALSPYFGRYLGYRVDSGKLALDLDYEITGSKLEAQNEVILERLQLGAPVQSEEATDAPVKLGLAMLRDGDGRIEINLPIEGNLSNPDFQLGQVMMNTFVNMVVKAAISPFSMLGSIGDMAGLSESELGNVEFNPGSNTMADGEEKKLEVIAQALAERPELLLNIRGAAVPELDGPGLKRDNLLQELGIDPSASISDRISRLEAAYQQRNNGSVQQLRKQAARNGGLSDNGWELALVDALTKDQSPSSNALQKLAYERANWLQRQLRETYDIPSEQLYVLDPVLDASAEAGTDNVKVPFQLDAR